jgi:hypothetical protein
MSAEETVTIRGAETVTVGDEPAARERFGWDTRSYTIRCHSGRVLQGRWAGVPVAALTDAAAVPPETTHLLVAGRDGYRACVDVRAAIGGLLAFDCEVLELVRGPGGEATCDPVRLPRFLADVESPRTVQSVGEIEARRIAQDDDPAAYETV